jgi:diguanylate cyclase (GGDEF)-like protein
MKNAREIVLRDAAELVHEARALLATDRAGARALAERACELADEAGNLATLTRALLVVGESLLADAHYDDAQVELRRGLAIAKEIGDTRAAGDALRALLKCAFFANRLDEAVSHGLEALKLSEKDEARASAVHNDLGLVYGRLADFEAALEHLLESLRLLKGQGLEPGASLLNNIGNVCLELDDHAQALDFFRAAHGAFAATNARRGEGIALGNIGRALAGLERWEQALDAFRQSVQHFREHADVAYLAPALARQGRAYAALGEAADARASFRESLDIAVSAGQREFLDEVLLAAGQFHLAQDEFDAGIALLSWAMQLLKPGEATPHALELHRTFAEAFEKAGDTASALRHYKEYLNAYRAVSETTTNTRIRRLMTQFNLEQAQRQEEIFRLRNVELARAYDELQTLHEQLEDQHRQLQQLSVEDALTGVFNRRYLDLQLEIEVSRALRHERPLSVAMCDVDQFKQINDDLSHIVGDEVLRQLGALLRQATRESDIVCRYGGDEFLIALPETPIATAREIVTRLRDAVRQHPWSQIHPELQVRLSLGIAELEPDGDLRRLLSMADARLYQAKRLGRDRVVG